MAQPLDEQEAIIDAWVNRHNQRRAERDSFDHRIADLERVCRHDLDAWRATSGAPGGYEDGSREWHAQQILNLIAEVRDAVRRGDWQRALSDAVAVGALAAQAHYWPDVDRWLNVRDRNRDNSARSADHRRASAARSRAALEAAVSALRQKHPNWSINSIAQQLLPEYGGDGQKALTALAKRISRLNPTK
jgi:hypothetical protein